MKNQILKFVLIFLALILLIIIYLSTIGIETDRFNNRIQKKISQVNNNLDVDFVKVSENIPPKKLVYITYDDYRRRFLSTAQTNNSDHYGTPDYVFKTQDDKFGLYRVPDSDGYTINYEYWKTHSDLSSSTDTPDIPARFHDVLVARAKYYVYQLRSDPQFTQFADKDYREGIKRMRIELINSPTVMHDTRINFGYNRRGAISG